MTQGEDVGTRSDSATVYARETWNVGWNVGCRILSDGATLTAEGLTAEGLMMPLVLKGSTN